MREDYKAAKKLAEEAVRKAEKEGRSPYLPVLDVITEKKRSSGQTHLGLMELPLSRIKGDMDVYNLFRISMVRSSNCSASST